MSNEYYAMGYGTEMDGCGRFMKYSLFFANFIIFIGGLAVTSLAIWALVGNVPYIGELFNNGLLTGAVYILLVGGIVVALIAFFGCVGASREVKCMLLTYFIIIFLLFVTMLIGGVLGYVFRAKIIDSAQQSMKSSMHFYGQKPQAWDVVQKSFQCCGVNTWRDWSAVGMRVPDSCCREINPGQYFKCNADADSLTASTAWVKGCINGTQLYVQRHAAVMGGAGIAVAILMFFGMIFSCALFRMIE